MVYVNIQWTNENLQLEALKYKTKSDFANGSRSAYFTSINRGILDKICSHMEEQIHNWTNQELHDEALKYSSRGEFQKMSRTAYVIAYKRQILDKICSHMKKSCGISAEEKELLAAISKVYPSAKRLRKTKIKVNGKPHIQGFDADIYVPELNKAVEFDGTYHHSFEGLKRARPNWSYNDIRNYHEIKDSYFLSIGIQILHIKEQDWKKDKFTCIQKCLDFLGGLDVEKVT